MPRGKPGLVLSERLVIHLDIETWTTLNSLRDQHEPMSIIGRRMLRRGIAEVLREMDELQSTEMRTPNKQRDDP